MYIYVHLFNVQALSMYVLPRKDLNNISTNAYKIRACALDHRRAVVPPIFYVCAADDAQSRTWARAAAYAVIALAVRTCTYKLQTRRQTTHRQYIDRQTDRQNDRHTDIQTYTDIDTHIAFIKFLLSIT